MTLCMAVRAEGTVILATDTMDNLESENVEWWKPTKKVFESGDIIYLVAGDDTHITNFRINLDKALKEKKTRKDLFSVLDSNLKKKKYGASADFLFAIKGDPETVFLHTPNEGELELLEDCYQTIGGAESSAELILHQYLRSNGWVDKLPSKDEAIESILSVYDYCMHHSTVLRSPIVILTTKPFEKYLFGEFDPVWQYVRENNLKKFKIGEMEKLGGMVAKAKIA